jgi:hypothetical protein
MLISLQKVMKLDESLQSVWIFLKISNNVGILFIEMKAQVLSQYGNKALSLAAAGMPPLMLLPYLESLRNLQGHHSGMQGFSANPLGSPQSVSSSSFTGIHPALSQLTPNFLGSSAPSSCSSTVTTKSSSSAPITSMVNFF